MKQINIWNYSVFGIGFGTTIKLQLQPITLSCLTVQLHDSLQSLVFWQGPTQALTAAGQSSLLHFGHVDPTSVNGGGTFAPTVPTGAATTPSTRHTAASTEASHAVEPRIRFIVSLLTTEQNV
jgi:hypothetical protein